jgi:NAD(P)-dependent dehydrogenase (short-subunit alcohol dehydrogenase family)
MDKVLLVTGVSSGLGRAIAMEALAAGYRVAGTVRNPKAAEGFESLSPERAKALILDVTDELAITAGVAQAERALGPSMRWSTTPGTVMKARWRNPPCANYATSSK